MTNSLQPGQNTLDAMLEPLPPQDSSYHPSFPSDQPPSEQDRFSYELRRQLNDCNPKQSTTDRGDNSDSWQPSSCPASRNHNLQKHAVVTLRKLGVALDAGLENSGAGAVAKQMWRIFLASGLKSKKMLVILFGRAQMQRDSYRELLRSCFFGEICSHGEELVRQAQDLLRERALALLGEEALRENVRSNRQIRQKEQFLAYFEELLALMRQGPLVKFRISAASSRKIEERVLTAASLDQSLTRRSTRSRH